MHAIPLLPTLLSMRNNAAETIRAHKNSGFMPDEAEPHTRTWMAFGVSENIWGRKLRAEAQRNLATIARAIAKF